VRDGLTPPNVTERLLPNNVG
jgi:hypothetical protein